MDRRKPHGEPTAGEGVGCAVIAGGMLLIGLCLVAAGYFAGDTNAYNYMTGGSSSVATTLFIIGAVFGALGVAASAILVIGRKG